MPASSVANCTKGALSTLADPHSSRKRLFAPLSFIHEPNRFSKGAILRSFSHRARRRRSEGVRAAHRDDDVSLFEVERPDSRTRVRPGTAGAASIARSRLESRRSRLLQELQSVEGALESVSEEATPSGDWGGDWGVAPDYSYLAKSAGRYTDDLPSGPPMNAVALGTANFRREFRELLATVTGKPTRDSDGEELRGGVVQEAEASREWTEALHDQQGGNAAALAGGQAVAEGWSSEREAREEVRKQIRSLTLSNDAVWAREDSREQVRSPFVLKAPYLLLCTMIDVLFDGRPIDRFWFLENVARMPYLSYVSMLHLYESLGWWRRGAQVRAIHFAEEWNEMHHLLIMESLGGDQAWSTRFFAQHASIAYFLALCFLWILSPTLAYNFSELIEAHAVDSYDQFVAENAEALKRIPPPPIALSYYMGEDLYSYDLFQSERPAGSRRIKLENLADVFEAISGDEAEHVKTMAACQKKKEIEAAADTEAKLAITATGVYLFDFALRYLADMAITEEMPGMLEGLYNFAQIYSESGAVEAFAGVLSGLLALLGM
jgi:ubiquinol oxidase